MSLLCNYAGGLATRVLHGYTVGYLDSLYRGRAWNWPEYRTIQSGVTTMITEKLLEIIKQEGVVAIATLGKDGPHMVNTWNSYVKTTTDGRLLIPVGGMHKTEVNIAHDSHVLITLGSRMVQGTRGAGAGFLIKGKACFLTSGPDYDFMKAQFGWLRATLAVTIESATQTL